MPQAIIAAASLSGWYAAAVYVAFTVATVAYSQHQKRSQEKRNREAYNAQLKDRELVIRSAVAPTRTIYGRDRVGGGMVFIHKEAPTPKEQFLYVVVSHASHECDAIEDLFLNETKLPEPDSNGFIQSGEYAKVTLETETQVLTANGSGEVVLTHQTYSEPVVVLIPAGGEGADGSGPASDSGNSANDGNSP